MSTFSSPLRFQPILKEKVWGGERLATAFGKPLAGQTSIGESWEISDHGTDLSRVAEGDFRGKTLRQLMREYPGELVGQEVETFPLLFKAIDASETLSVQVHPTDSDAATLEPGNRGKTEAWAIVEAEPGARIVDGIATGLSLEEFYDRVSAAGEGTSLEELFHWREVRRGDVIFLPAGTIHAIGGGIVLVEIQQSSDITYRIYDWGRPRELHLEKARKVSPPPSRDPGPLPCWLPHRQGEGKGSTACSRWPVVECEYFSMEAIHAGVDSGLELSTRAGGAPRFAVLIGLAGEAEVRGPAGPMRLQTGEFLFVPAALEAVSVSTRTGDFSGLWVIPGVL